MEARRMRFPSEVSMAAKELVVVALVKGPVPDLEDEVLHGYRQQ